MPATTEDVARLRLMIGTTDKSDDDLLLVLDAEADDDGTLNFNRAAAVIWDAKANDYVGLVDVSESGSSRKFSDLSKNAAARAAFYRGQITDVVVSVSDRPKVNQIVRP